MSEVTFEKNGDAGSSRDRILAAVRRVGLPEKPLPEIECAARHSGDLVASFTASIEAAKGAVWRVGRGGVAAAVASAYPNAGLVVSGDPATGGASTHTTPVDSWGIDDLDDHDPAEVDVLVCRGELAVAENGAVWVSESSMGERAAPYLSQHLVLVIDEGTIVEDMHAAYRRLDVAAEGFGAFIAGPSKTADIEQSLVIGAHGPRSLTVLLE